MEACSSSHHFARIFIRQGHEVRIMPPRYVKPYVKTNKTDAADAEAICEAITRPNMRFVQVETIEQQAVIALHTERDLYMRQRTATSNSLRAMLSELGFCIPTGMSALYKSVPAILEDAEMNSRLLCVEVSVADWTKYRQKKSRLHRLSTIFSHGSRLNLIAREWPKCRVLAC